MRTLIFFTFLKKFVIKITNFNNRTIREKSITSQSVRSLIEEHVLAKYEIRVQISARAFFLKTKDYSF